MHEQEQPNPFENHINSDKFDVSSLENAPRVPHRRSDLEIKLQDLLDDLPQPLNYELWDTELDERQKHLCAYLTAEIVERVIREQHGDAVSHMSDDELTYFLTVPITLAMIAEERLHERERVPVKNAIALAEQDADTPPLHAPNYQEFPELPQSWSELSIIVKNFVTNIKNFFIRIFRRY